MPVSMRELTRDVWSNNLDDAMRDLRRLVDAFPYIAIDCEFPAVVARPIGKFKTSTDYHYQTMRCNVDILKLIQLGITLVNDDGAVAQDCTWQFNFYFNTDEDTYEPSSIDALSKAGLDFARHRTHGIEPAVFAELMITSGLVLSDDTTWISYHGAYDFGYLLRMLTGAPLPLTEEDFFRLIKTWFPALYDIKYIMRQIKPTLKGGLTDIANDLGVSPSFGPPPPPNNSSLHSSMMQQHAQPALFTSGYASFLAATTFHHIIDHYVLPGPGATTVSTPGSKSSTTGNSQWDISAFQGALYGLGSTYVGVMDVGGRGLTGAERERPGVGGANARDGNSTPAGGASSSALGGMGGMGMGMGLGGVGGVGMNLGGVMSPSALHHSTSHHLGLGSGAFGGVQTSAQAQAQAQREYAQQIQAVAAAAQAQAAASGHGHGLGMGSAGMGMGMGIGPMGGLGGLGGIGVGGMGMGVGGMNVGGMGGMGVGVGGVHPGWNGHHHHYGSHHLQGQSTGSASQGTSGAASTPTAQSGAGSGSGSGQGVQTPGAQTGSGSQGAQSQGAGQGQGGQGAGGYGINQGYVGYGGTGGAGGYGMGYYSRDR